MMSETFLSRYKMLPEVQFKKCRAVHTKEEYNKIQRYRKVEHNIQGENQ